jgi:hypothetical protein
MRLGFEVVYVDGNKDKVICGAPDFIAFEQKFEIAITRLQNDPRFSYLAFLVWNSLRRNKKTDKSFEDWCETIEVINGDETNDPKSEG